MFYGGTMEPAVLARRITVGRTRPEQKLWLGPAVSLAPTVGSVLNEMGTLVVAMANRAFRGDLFERGIPEALHADVHAMWKSYDYAYHADFESAAEFRDRFPSVGGVFGGTFRHLGRRAALACEA